MRNAVVITLLCITILVLGAPAVQAQSPDVVFSYASSAYTSTPYNLTSPIPGSGYDSAVYTAGTGYKLTSSYLSDGVNYGNRSCIQHYFGGTFTSLTRFIVVTSGSVAAHRLSLVLYDSAGTSIYSSYWDSAPGTRDITVSRSNAHSARLCLTGQANVNNPNAYINSFSIYGTFVQTTAAFTADPESGTAPLEVTFTDESLPNGSITDWEWDFDGDSTIDSTDQNPTHTYSTPGTYSVTLTVTASDATTDSETQFITVSGAFTRALSEIPGSDSDGDLEYLWDDATAVSDPDNPLTDILARDPYSVAAMSDNPGDYVYALAGGTVEGIEKLESGDCFGLYETPYEQCLLRRDPSAFSEPEGVTDELYFVDTSPLYRVVVTFDDTYSLEYIVTEPLVYAGMVIQQNCIIGLTAELLSLDSGQITYYSAMAIAADLLWTPNINSLAGKGIAFVSLFDFNTYIRTPLRFQMTEPVVPGAACNASGGSCINDSTFNDPGQWFTTGDVEFLPLTGITLQPGAAIGQMFPFQSGTSYSLTASIWRTSNTGTVHIDFSEASSTFLLGFMQDYTLSHDFEDGDDLLIQIVNTGSEAFTVKRFCITDGSSAAPIPQCYFQNPSFDLGLDGWSTSGTVSSGEVGGSIQSHDNGTIFQSVHLHPDGETAHNYRIYITAFLPTAFIDESGTYIQFDYTFGTYSGTFTAYGESSDPVSFTSFATYPSYSRTFALDLEVGIDTEQNFYIVSNLTGSTSGFFVQIADVCIDDAFETRPPGDPPLKPVCTRVETPSGDANVGAWTVYLWGNLNNFFQCDLMVLLNQMYKVTSMGVSFIRWSATYTEYVIARYNTYLWDVFGWLGGHFSNMANGRTTIIQSSGSGQCSDLFCVIGILFDGIADFIGGLDELGTAIVDGLAGSFQAVVDVISQLLDIIRLVLDFLIGIIEQVLGLLIDVISALFSFLFRIFNTALIAVQRALGLFDTMGSLWNEMNTSIPMGSPEGEGPELESSTSIYEIDPGVGEGASNENDALSGLSAFLDTFQCGVSPRTKPFCITTWLVDNTIMYSFGEWLFWAIVLISSPSAILWAISRFRKVVTSLKST